MTLDGKDRGASGAAAASLRGAESLARELEELKAAQSALLETMRRASLQVQVIEQLGHEEELLTGDIDGLARKITERAAGAIGCERVNIWLFDEAGTTLRCVDSFEATPARHSAGEILREDEYRNEFEVLRQARYVAADDPLTDPRTAGYVETYLKPLRITSMVDAVIQLSGKHLGLICFEHVDRPITGSRTRSSSPGSLPTSSPWPSSVAPGGRPRKNRGQAKENCAIWSRSSPTISGKSMRTASTRM